MKKKPHTAKRLLQDIGNLRERTSELLKDVDLNDSEKTYQPNGIP